MKTQHSLKLINKHTHTHTHTHIYLIQRTDSLEKTLMLVKIEGGGGEGDNRG